MGQYREQNEPTEPDTRTESILLRIYVLGPLRIEWVGQATPFPPERLQGRGAAPAISLLRALLCQEHRFALKDWLMEQFWPDTPHRKAAERLDDVASGLRCLLRPPESQEKILHYVYGTNGSGSGYRLEGSPQIWVDADAFSGYVEQAALLDRFGDDSLPCWEQAYELAKRGRFLIEEPYSDWAKQRRETLEGHYRQCIHRVTGLLRQAGAHEQAMLRLRTYWQQYPADEDALRPLMELLCEMERYQEAQTYYSQAQDALQREGREPDSRTQDVMTYIHLKQVQRTRENRNKQEHSQRMPSSQGRMPLLSSMGTSRTVAVQEFPLSTPGYTKKEKESLAVRVQTLPTQAYNKKHMDQKRRELLHLLSSAGAALILPFPDVDWERIQEGFANPSRLDEIMLHDLEAINRHFWSLYLTASSKSSVLDGVLGQVKTLFHFLRDFASLFYSSATLRTV